MTECNNTLMANAMQSKKDKFIQLSNDFHNSKYDYSLLPVKILFTDKVKIICPQHGEFEQQARRHMLGRGCSFCAGKKENQDLFIAKVKSIHGDKYDFSKSIYNGAFNKVTVICYKHGDFLITPDSLKRGVGCAKCGDESGSKKRMIGTDLFLARAKEVHGDRYDYSKVIYKKRSSNIIIGCSVHGYFKQTPSSHLSGANCHKCSDLERGAMRTHNLDELQQRNANLKIIKRIGSRFVLMYCEKHGEFQKKIAKIHKGCGMCAVENDAGWGLTSFNARAVRHDSKANLYIIRCKSDKEKFYKVGITLKDITERFARGRIPYEYEVLKIISENAEFIWKLEKQIHALLHEYKYCPELQFNGKTECFSQVPKEVFCLLDGIKKSNQPQLLA
ncbi:hypothetical protein ABLT66_00255 [Acinetobacter junii]|uniref:hypothetical protein n=1 Tax=Acinetobacter junii TaxID=40215 RepID=UPI0032B392DE